jgi:phage baseplate assembly protein gpV
VRPGTPRQPSANTRYVGVVYGVVTQNKDPDNMNRVKVRFPWLDKGDVEQSHWAQLMTPMEGKEFGWYTLPDVDDVVCVVFMHGDMNHPVIVGGIWSKEDKPPEPNEDGKNNFRGFRSRTGHRLILDDTAKTKVVLSDTTTDLMVGVGQWDKDGAGPNTCAVFKPKKAGTAGVSISSMKGNVELSCPKGKLTIEAGKNIHLDVKASAELQAGGEFGGDAKTTKLTAGAPASFKGSKVYAGP